MMLSKELLLEEMGNTPMIDINDKFRFTYNGCICTYDYLWRHRLRYTNGLSLDISSYSLFSEFFTWALSDPLFTIKKV